MTSRKVTTTQLDFTQIKSALKTFFEDSGDFNDYDFEGSALNSLLDVLAYNTHFNALLANFALNEAFLDSAQLRGSVVSHAKPLGYLPTSKTAAVATVDVTALAVPSGTSDLSLPKYSLFTSTIDGDTYNFYTLDEYTADEAGDYVFEDVELYEGSLKTKKFLIDADENNYELYVIPDENMDTSTASVIMREGYGASTYETYSPITSIADLDADSQIYIFYEAPNGYYEIQFGDGNIGVRPPEGSIAEITYISTNGKDANNAASFATDVTVSGYSLSAALVTKAYGGADKESIESIRFNAPLSFASQDRIVTVADYKTHIQNGVSFVESINVWGGEDNDPPEYGKVFICIKPTGASAMTAAQETSVESVIGDKSVVTISTEYVDPDYEYLQITLDYQYDNSKTTLTKTQLDAAVKASIVEFADDNLSNFDSTFRKSNLLTYIDASSTAIVSSDCSVVMQKRISPTLGGTDRYDVPFTQQIAAVDDYDYVVTSNGFEYTVNSVAYTCYLRNVTGSTQLEIYRISSGSQVIVADDAGYIDTATNTVVITPFSPTALVDAVNGVKIKVIPNDDSTIVSLRNMLLDVDEDLTSASGAMITS